MAYVRDQHKKDPSRSGKRWLAVWLGPDGRERTRAFAKKVDADNYAGDQAVDVRRGDYIDPSAAKTLFGELGKRWLRSRTVDPSTAVRYETTWRLHVEPAFGRRAVGTIKPSEVQELLVDLGERFAPSTATAAKLVVGGVMELAVADGSIRRNPARSRTVTVPKRADGSIVPWTDAQVLAVVDGHPDHLRPIPVLGASCGLREGEAFGLAAEDVDLEEGIVRVRRQVKRLSGGYVFALPKNDRERTVPLPEWAAQVLRVHMAHHRPVPYTLPWEKPDRRPCTVNLLFRWTDDRHVRARLYSEQVWKPALVRAGVIPAPTRDKRGRKRYATTRREGTHQLRHWYASTTLADGVSVKELAEYLGHHDPAFTLRIYAHMIPSSFERARSAIDARLFRPRAVAGSESHGPVTDQEG